MNLFNDSITVWRATQGVDKYGNPVTTWDPALGKTTFSGVSVQPDYAREELVDGGDRIVATTGLKVISRPGTDIDILKTDRVLYGDMDGSAHLKWYSVDGEAARFRLRSKVHHVEFRLKTGMI